MDTIQVIKEKLLERIQRLDCGNTVVAAKLQCSESFLQKTLSPTSTRKSRLATLEKIKEAIVACEKDQEARIEVLLA